MSRKKILALFDHFYPSFKSGGPAKSALGFAELLSDQFEIKIFTSDRDFGAVAPHENVLVDTWVKMKGFEVCYASEGSRGRFGEIVESFQPDFIYINSLFSFHFSIRPLKVLRKLRWQNFKVILAPRGELAISALAKSPLRKWIYLTIYPWLVEFPKTVYEASSSFEESDIKRELKGRISLVAQDLRPPSDLESVTPSKIDKKPGELRICLISRVNQVKNIHSAIQWVKELNHPGIQFDIYGFREDETYYNKCLEKLSTPSKSIVNMRDGLESAEVIPVIQQYHLFFLPTLGENFGHSVLESFMAGRPVLISDKTPWRNLSDVSAGFDVSLKDELVKEKINHFVQMNDVEFSEWTNGARLRAEKYFNDPGLLTPYLTLFS